MSVEALVISGLVDAESPRPAYQAGVSKDDFEIFDEEFEWVEKRFEARKSISPRIFRERFPEFEFALSKEKLDDLLDELKNEKAYSKIGALIETVSETLLPENAIETAENMREVLSDVLKMYSPHSDISMKDSRPHLETVKAHRVMSKAGQTFGMPTLIPSIDYHWDGLVPGRLIGILGRPGEGKSYTIAIACWVAVKLGYNVALFSPEMNEFEHLCRVHTLASADPEVQAAVGLKQSFRNRDLMRGTNFNLKKYKEFCDYFDNELPGNAWIFTKKYRKGPLTPHYISSRVEDLSLNGIIVDPISKISSRRRNDNAVWEAYDKVHAFQELLEEHNIFGVATNWSTRQMGRSRSEKAPDLDESFGSDALAQESDHVVGLKHDAEDKTLTMRCSKSRFGKARFTAVLDFHPNTGYWQEINLDHEVAGYRASLNGKAAQNGVGKRVIHKARKAIGRSTNGGQ